MSPLPGPLFGRLPGAGPLPFHLQVEAGKSRKEELQRSGKSQRDASVKGVGLCYVLVLPPHQHLRLAGLGVDSPEEHARCSVTAFSMETFVQLVVPSRE